MTKHKQIAKTRLVKTNRNKTRPTDLIEPMANLIDLVELPGQSVETHFITLGEGQISGIQRRALVAQMEKVGGNRYIQRAITVLKKEGQQEAFLANRLLEGKYNNELLSSQVVQDVIQPEENGTFEMTDQHFQWAFEDIHYWLTTAKEAVSEVPSDKQESMLDNALALIPVLTPLITAIPGGTALVATFSEARAIISVARTTVEQARRAQSEMESGRNEAVKEDMNQALDAIESELQSRKETEDFETAVRNQFNIYNQMRLAIWYSIFPNIGYSNRAQIKQEIKASIFQEIYRRSGLVSDLIPANRETVIAAIVEALIEFERWQATWGTNNPSYGEIIRHFNEVYTKTMREKFNRRNYNFYIFHGVNEHGRPIVSPGFNSLFGEAERIYGKTIRVRERR